MSITKPVPSVSNKKLQWIFNFSYYYKILDLLTHSNLLLNCINQHNIDILLFTILFYYSFFIFSLFFNVQYQRLSPSPTFSSPQSTNFKVEFFLSSQNFLKINIQINFSKTGLIEYTARVKLFFVPSVGVIGIGRSAHPS